MKNRFGPADEVGCFELADDGIHGLADPSGLFLSGSRTDPEPGTCVTVTLEGRRPLVAEVQALAVAAGASPRRTTSGLDGNRVALLLAVLERHAKLRLPGAHPQGGPGGTDVYASTVGGMRISEPAADLAIALADRVIRIAATAVLRGHRGARRGGSRRRGPPGARHQPPPRRGSPPRLHARDRRRSTPDRRPTACG